MIAIHVAGTTPYPWPFDGRLAPLHVALVIAGGGDVGDRVPSDRGAAACLAQLRSELHPDVLRVVVEHALVSSRIGPPGSPPGPTPTPLPGELAVGAVGLDAFHGGSLDAVLRAHRRTHVLVVGAGLESAVHSTMRSANDRGFECLLVADACAAHDPALRAASISTVEMSGGIFGAVGTTDAVLERLGDPGRSPDPLPASPPEES